MLRRWLAVGAIILGAVLLASAAYGTSLDSTCASCHEAQHVALSDSSHTSVTCYGCHLEDGAWGFLEQKRSEWFRMYPASFRGDDLTGPGRRISRSTCLSCHVTPPEGVVESKGLRFQHAVCAAPPTYCDTCHNSVAHGEAVRWQREPVMDECLACHESYGASTECDTCHVGKLERERLTSGPWQVTHGAKWQDTHGMGDLASCSACHPTEKCVGCHNTEIPHPDDFFKTHGKQALEDDARCENCHRTGGWCTSCHGVEMPHAPSFLKEHSEVAAHRKDPTCLKCHAPEDCINCHVAHTHPGMTEGTLGSGSRSGGDR